MRDFVTEKEAETKWCPHIRFHIEANDVASDNRLAGETDSSAHCLASKCMFWRWSHQDTGPNDPPTGFCGAAGFTKFY